jgi:hypothetical protein
MGRIVITNSGTALAPVISLDQPKHHTFDANHVGWDNQFGFDVTLTFTAPDTPLFTESAGTFSGTITVQNGTKSKTLILGALGRHPYVASANVPLIIVQDKPTKAKASVRPFVMISTAADVILD